MKPTAPTAPTAPYETRSADMWDLLTVQHAFMMGRAVTSIWHTGSEAGRVAKWKATFRRTAGVAEIVLSEPSDGTEEVIELDLDYYGSPDKAGRHLVHTDLRGVTFCHIDGTPRATYRLTDIAPAPDMTPDEMYADDPRTCAALVAALTGLGYPAEIDRPEIGQAYARVSAHQTAQTGYLVLSDWAGPLKAWALVPVHKQDNDGVYWPDEWKQAEETINLHLPLNTPVEAVAVAAADWFSVNAPDLRTP